MKRTSKYIKWPGKPVSLIAAAMLLTFVLEAQDRDTYDSLAARYKSQHAVYTNITEQLVISVEDGDLVANSHSVLEKLFISDHALNRYNLDYFVYGDFNALTNYSGNAYLPAKGKTYKTVKCNTFGSGRPHDYVFFDDLRVAQAYYSGLTKNAVTETRYSIWHTDVRMLPSFEFQDIYQSLPVASATFEVVAPRYVEMNFVIKGENTSWIKQSKEEKNGKVYYRFTAANVPAPKDFANVPSWRYYVPHVIPYIVSYRLPGAKKDSVLAKGTDDMYKYYYNYVRSKNLTLDTFLTKTVAKITKHDVSDREKAARIYKWVQDNIRYVAIENGLEGFVPRPADTVYKRKYGDCKDMSSIIAAMCRRVGIKAYFAWVGTNTLPYSYEETPIHISNHMICAVKLDGEWVFLDGTHPYLPFGRNREDIQGKEAMIAIDEKNYEVVKIPVEAADKNGIADSTYITINDHKITGTSSQVYRGYDAWNLGHQLMYNRNEEEKQKMVKNLTMRGTNKYELGKYMINAADNGDKDISVNAAFAVDHYVRCAGKECYVNMNLTTRGDDGRIDTKDRVAANYFDYKSKHKEVVVMEIPKGYKVAYLPPAAKGSLGDQWSYSIVYKANKKTVTLTKEYEVNTLSIGKDKFAGNNKMVDELKNNYKESVVLTTN